MLLIPHFAQHEMKIMHSLPNLHGEEATTSHRFAYHNLCMTRGAKGAAYHPPLNEHLLSLTEVEVAGCRSTYGNLYADGNLDVYHPPFGHTGKSEPHFSRRIQAAARPEGDEGGRHSTGYAGKTVGESASNGGLTMPAANSLFVLSRWPPVSMNESHEDIVAPGQEETKAAGAEAQL
jgi:hypothetical protein